MWGFRVCWFRVGLGWFGVCSCLFLFKELLRLLSLSCAVLCVIGSGFRVWGFYEFMGLVVLYFVLIYIGLSLSLHDLTT